MRMFTKLNLLLVAALSFLAVTDSSFYCMRPAKTIPVDSIHYFKPGQVWITVDDLKDTSIRLRLPDGMYTFFKDSSMHFCWLRPDKDAKTFYQLIRVNLTGINDTAVMANIRYQAFNKRKQTSDSKVYRLNDYPVPLKMIKTFTVSLSDYDKVFPGKGSSSGMKIQ